MAQEISQLREEIDRLSTRQKAELVRTLIDSLDQDLNENVEQLWLDEAAQRCGGGIFAGSRATEAMNPDLLYSRIKSGPPALCASLPR